MDLQNIIFWSMFTICLFCMGIAIYSVHQNYELEKYYNNSIESFRMYAMQNLSYDPTYNFTAVDGLAFGNDYFCVWSKNKNITHVLNVCAHEWAHTHEGLLDPPQKVTG